MALQNRSTKFQQASVANADNSLDASKPKSGTWPRLAAVLVHYSAVPVHAGITITVKPIEGAAYDTVLDQSAANAQDYAYIPPNDFYIGPNDKVTVDAPAGGAGITSAISIILE